jgi:hypothetical protein
MRNLLSVQVGEMVAGKEIVTHPLAIIATKIAAAVRVRIRFVQCHE